MQEDEEQAEADKEASQSGSDACADSTQSERNQDDNDDYDYDKKSDTAEDFSEINELAEDLQSAMLPEKAPATGDNYDEPDEKGAKSTDKTESSPKDGIESSKEQSTGASDETKSSDNDKELMPPPSIPVKPSSR